MSSHIETKSGMTHLYQDFITPWRKTREVSEMPKQFIQYVNFLLFSADQIMQELLEDSIFGKLLYNLDCRGISQNMIQNCYGFRYFCIGNYLRNTDTHVTKKTSQLQSHHSRYERISF